MKRVFYNITCISIAVTLLSFAWPSKLEQKIHKTINKTFSIEKFNLEEVTVNKETEDATKVSISDHLYKITTDSNPIGYIYVGKAPSMKNVFDYAIVLSPELEIVNVKVLIYREKHGRQIGMKRWLKQFFGMNETDRPEIGMQVDGISGATISATSMTDAVRNVLSSLDYLQKKEKL